MIMKAMLTPKKVALSDETVQKILRKVPNQEAFYFSRGIGDYTGQVAASLAEFAEMLRTVDSKAIDFHMERRDFERWIRNVLGDEELAQNVNRTMGWQGDKLRNELVLITMKRLEDLNRMQKNRP